MEDDRESLEIPRGRMVKAVSVYFTDEGMSLSERLKTRRSPDPAPGVLSRSRSFAGLLTHRRTSSASPAFGGFSTDGSSISSGGSSSNSSTLSRSSILGQSHSPNTPRKIIQGLSSTWTGKPPRSPRPARTLLIFNAIEKGLKECISLTQEDIMNLRTSVENLSVTSSQSQGKLYDLEKQLKAAERYLKRLEFQLSKVEELKDLYEVQQKMKDGVRTMAYAYVLSPGGEKETALHSVRSGYRECVDTLCTIEAELERMLGTLQFQMKGIQGFARLCAGDVFEITVKHGDQKWKSRGKVLKNLTQQWDNPNVIVKALLGEFLFIKAVEVRGLGKNMLLGNKSCEIKDLFSSHSQLMTINLNSSGSLKLNLVITWNPLHGCLEDTPPKPTQTPLLMVFGSPFLKRRGTSPVQEDGSSHSVSSSGLSHHYHNNRHHLNDSYQNLADDSYHYSSSNSSVSAPGSTLTSPETDFPPRTLGQAMLMNSLNHSSVRSPTLQQMEITTSQRWSSVASAESSECGSMDLGSGSHLDGNSLQEVVHNLSSCLEDIQGQYPELHSLEQSVMELEKLLRRRFNSRRDSTGSNISISVESALGCFDFLNSAIDGDDTESSEGSPVRHPTENGSNLDAENTAKTSDSGIASLARQLHDENGQASSPSIGSSPAPPSTGSEQLDCALITHLSYCIRLVENLGSYGPLRCREIFSLDKLRKQALAVESLLKLVHQYPEDRQVLNGSRLIKGSHVSHIWDQLSGGGDALCVGVEQLQSYVEKLVYSQVNQSQLSERVTKTILSRMLDVTKVEADAIVTVLQFASYFGSLNKNVEEHIKDICYEIKTVDYLLLGDSAVVKKTLSELKTSPPAAESVFVIAQMLVGVDQQLRRLAESHIRAVADTSPQSRKQLCAIILEGLESESAQVRQGCCAAISLIQARDYIEQLQYLTYADEVSQVQHQAKEVLLSFGDEGRKAVQQSQLFTHGFQGLSVK